MPPLFDSELDQLKDLLDGLDHEACFLSGGFRHHCASFPGVVSFGTFALPILFERIQNHHDGSPHGGWQDFELINDILSNEGITDGPQILFDERGKYLAIKQRYIELGQRLGYLK